MPKIAVIVGTRPEAIKLAPLIQKLKASPAFELTICNTGQHDTLCGEILAFFGISADEKLNVMRENQDLASLQARLLTALDSFLLKAAPDAIIVQGDTMSAFCGALAGFYRRVPVFHVEAGLRSGNLREPFPEEGLRQMLSRTATLHFAPTKGAAEALIAEKIPEKAIFVTGNTVIDALGCLTPQALAQGREKIENLAGSDRKLILVTVHRRENHGARLLNILEAILALSHDYPDYVFLLPVHPNPNVGVSVRKVLSDRPNVILTGPLNYPELVYAMQNATLILTDSGGIQEEAPTFGVPVLVLRYKTERLEGVRMGLARLVGVDSEKIREAAARILDGGEAHPRKDCVNPYGDGHASNRIMKIIGEYFGQV